MLTTRAVSILTWWLGSLLTARVVSILTESAKRAVTQAPHLVEHVADTGRQHEKPDEPAEPAAVGPADDVVPSDAEAASAAAAAGRSRPAGIGRLRWDQPPEPASRLSHQPE